MSVSIPTGFAIGHLLTDNSAAIARALDSSSPTEAATPPKSEVLIATEHRAPPPTIGDRPPFVNNLVEADAVPETVEPSLDSVWAMVSKQPAEAKSGFETYLRDKPGDPEGHYGLGYLYLKQGERDLSAQHLCRAQHATDSETARDVRQLIKRNRLRCSEG